MKPLRTEDELHGHDLALARAVRAGDRDSFDRFFHTYFDRVHAYLARRVGPAKARAAMEPALTRILASLERYDGHQSLAAWVLVETKAIVSSRSGISAGSAPPGGTNADPHPGSASERTLGLP
jgi:hypothetical protein